MDFFIFISIFLDITNVKFTFYRFVVGLVDAYLFLSASL